MKSMGSGWENLKIQLALKGLTLKTLAFCCPRRCFFMVDLRNNARYQRVLSAHFRGFNLVILAHALYLYYRTCWFLL